MLFEFNAGFAIGFYVSIITLDNKDSPSAKRINLYLNTGPIIKPSLCLFLLYTSMGKMASVEIVIIAVDTGNSCFIEISVDLYIKYQFIRERKKVPVM